MTSPQRHLEPVADTEPGAPSVIPVEQATLGAMMESPAACQQALALLTAADFYRPAHRILFATIGELHRDGQPHDPVAVLVRLQHDGTLDDIGGGPYLHSLYADAFLNLNGEISTRVQAIIDTARQRQLTDLGRQLTTAAGDPAANHTAIAATYAERLLETSTPPGGFDDITAVEKAWYAYLDDTSKDAVASWGIRDLDRLTRGLRPGQVIVVAGRPSMGKSSLGIQVAWHVAKHHPVAFASYEMSQAEVYAHMLAAEARIPLSQALSLAGLTLGNPVDSGIQRLQGSRLRWVNGLPDIDTLTGLVTDACKRDPLALLVVDYLQLIPVQRSSTQNREQEVAAISRALKLLARRLEIPILAMAQLNREVTSRADKRPVLTDLRESGSIEMDADAVVLLHRPDYYDHDSPRAGEADLIVAKQRMGPTDTVTARWHAQRAMFYGMAPEEAP